MIGVKHNMLKGYGSNNIHYQCVGDGPAIVFCNGLGVSTGFWGYIIRYFERTSSIITWDYRGHGKSAPAESMEGWTIQNTVDDLLMVLDDAGIDKAVLVGHSMGVQVILEAHRMAPDRVAGLIPICGSYGDPLKTFFNFPMADRVFNVLHYIGVNRAWAIQPITRLAVKLPIAFDVAKLFLIDKQLAKREDFRDYLKHLGELDLRVFFHMARAAADHSARDHLPHVQCPVLVIGGENDVFTPFHLCETMVREIPDAQLLKIRRGSHAALVEQPDLINLRIEKFFREKLPEWAMDRSNAG